MQHSQGSIGLEELTTSQAQTVKIKLRNVCTTKFT